ncbi:YobH family protein [Cedecea lapagei]|nr:YobH family protein [Cedecea lapagei]
MRVILRTIVIIAIIWIGLLLSGYGVLIGSKENAAGLGLQCKYLTARNTVTAQFIHTDSGIIGLTDCPLLRKVDRPVDNG